MSSPTESSSSYAGLSSYPPDMALCTVLGFGCWYGVVTLQAGGIGRGLLALPLLFFLPGYALCAVLFPGRHRTESETPYARILSGVDRFERLALSFALSVVVVMLVAIVLAIVGYGIEPGPAAGGLALFTIVTAQVGAKRRLAIPQSERFSMRSIEAFDAIANVDRDAVPLYAGILVVSIVVCFGVLAVALVAPPAQASFTEVALYGEDENGSQEIGAIPPEVEPNTTIPIATEVSNNHDEDRTYSVVIQEEYHDNESVVNRSTVDEYETTVDAGESIRTETNVTPTASIDESVRFVVLVYETDDGSVPDEPSIDNADHALHFWVHVVEDPDDDGTIIV